MTHIRTTTHIQKPLEVVFEFVTTPGNWPRWHPSSLGVVGATDHSLEVGERCTETFRVAGRRGEVVWTVKERQAPRRWSIEGVIVGRTNGGIVTYTLTPREGGTFFEREFEYLTPGLLFTVVDRLAYRRRVTAESIEALRRLKACLET